MTRFQVTLQPSGHVYQVEEDETLLDAGLAAGLVLPHGCRSGGCGLCKVKVLQGEVQQDDAPLTTLSEEERAQGMALLCSAHALSDVVLDAHLPEGIGGIVPRKLPARIEHVEWAAPDVAILTLKLPASERFAFHAGQYVDFLLPSGLRRSYSIASRPVEGATALEFHIRHMPGGAFTDALFGVGESVVKERSLLRIEGPLGGFYLREEGDAPLILLASGTGFAPIKSIVETIFAKGLERARADGGGARPITLYWGARKRADLYLDALPRRWEAEHPGFRYIPVLSEPDAADAQHGAWTGRTGFVHQAVMEDFPDLSGHQVYACGVPIMVQSAHRDFTSRCRLPEESFFSDAFLTAADTAAAKKKA